MRRVAPQLNLNITRHLQRAAATNSEPVTVESIKKAPRNVFGTLSESGRGQLARRIAEQDIIDDASGHDKLEIDYAPRKNHYYYKYEITKQARMGRLGLRRALELFHEMKAVARLQPTMDNFSPLIYGCAKAGYTKRAFELYDEQAKHFRQPSNSVITCLLNSCAESPFPDYGLKRLDWFLKHVRVDLNRKLNEAQYNSAIKAYGKLGRLDEASRLVQEMLDNNIYPTVTTFDMLLIGCASNKEAGCALALRVYKRMKMYEMKPGLVTYRLLLRCIRDCEMGSPQLIADTINELPAITSLNQRLAYENKMKQRRNPKDKHKPSFAWAPLLSDLGKSVADAVQISDSKSLVSKNSEVNSDSPAPPRVGISAKPPEWKNGSKSGQLITTTQGHQEMLPNLLSDDHLSLVTRIKGIQFDKLSTACERLMLFGGLHGYLGIMLEEGCKPDNKTFSLILQCLVPSRENYLEYYKLAQELDIKRDLVFYDLLIQHICDQWLSDSSLEMALQFVGKMHLDELRPNISTFEALATGCKNWTEASRLISDVENCGAVVSDLMIARFFNRAIFRQDFAYLKELIGYAKVRKFVPHKQLLDKLESLRLRTHEKIVKQEKLGETHVERALTARQIENYDLFRELLGSWLLKVDVLEDDHPWAQFQVEHGSKNANFREYAKQMSLADRVKRESLEKGEALGNLYAKSMKLMSDQK